jgi:glucose dehydrogenase
MAGAECANKCEPPYHWHLNFDSRNSHDNIHVETSVQASSFAAAIGAAGVARYTASQPAAGGRLVGQQLRSKRHRYSPLTQITPANVATLQRAWSIHLKPAAIPAS